MTGSGGNGRSLQRERDIAELVIGGGTLAELSERYGVRTPGAATRLVERALDGYLPHLDASLVRRVDLARLDQVLRVWWDRALEGDAFATRVVLAVIDARSRVLAPERDSLGSTDERASGPLGMSAVEPPD